MNTQLMCVIHSNVRRSVLDFISNLNTERQKKQKRMKTLHQLLSATQRSSRKCRGEAAAGSAAIAKLQAYNASQLSKGCPPVLCQCFLKKSRNLVVYSCHKPEYNVRRILKAKIFRWGGYLRCIHEGIIPLLVNIDCKASLVSNWKWYS